MANNRVYYAILGVGLARMGSEDYIPVHGLQSATLDLNFALEHILEIGQLETYESKEDMLIKLDVFLLNNRITQDQYNELVSMLNEQG